MEFSHLHTRPRRNVSAPNIFFSGLGTPFTSFFGPLGASGVVFLRFFRVFNFEGYFLLLSRLSWTPSEGQKCGFRLGESTIFLFFHVPTLALFWGLLEALTAAAAAASKGCRRPRGGQTPLALLFLALRGLPNFFFGGSEGKKSCKKQVRQKKCARCKMF